MNKYTDITEDWSEEIAALIEKNHFDLNQVGASVAVLLHETDSPEGLKLRGQHCYATARRTNNRERACGAADCIITVCSLRFNALRTRQKKAVLDHELQHFEPATDREGNYRRQQGRPVIKIRRHDREFGWFDEIAKRWGKDSIERLQCTGMLNDETFQESFQPSLPGIESALEAS